GRGFLWSFALVPESSLEYIGWRRVGDFHAINVGERGKNAWFTSLRSNNVLDANASDKQCVPDHRPMTAPRNGFGAHQDTALRTRQFRDPLNVLAELRGLHVIRIASKREIVPAGVGRIGTRVAQASETRKMDISNLDRVQRNGKCVSIELGIAARARHGPHIKHSGNFIAPKQIEERIYRPR